MSQGNEFWVDGRVSGAERGPEIMFGQVREDTALEGSLARGKCLCIASGGETAFDLLLGGAESVLAVDVNPAQVWLVELKRAILAQLPYGAVLQAMTSDASTAFSEVAAGLSPAAAAYFKNRPRILKRGLQNCGTVDQKLIRLGIVLQAFVHSRAASEAFLRLEASDRQPQRYAQDWDNWRWRAALELLANPFALRIAFGAVAVRGVSRENMRAIGRDVVYVLNHVPSRRNPYVWQALLGRYPPDGLPEWLTPEGFESLRRRLGRLQTEVQDAAAAVEGGNGQFDTVCLSNVLDMCEQAYWKRVATAIPKGTSQDCRIVCRSLFPLSSSGKGNLVELSEGALSPLDIPLWTDRSFFCRNVSLMQVVA